MKETIRVPYVLNTNAVGQAVFLAQQHYNKNGMGDRVVTGALFVGEHIEVEYVFSEKTVDRVALAAAERQKMIESFFNASTENEIVKKSVINGLAETLDIPSAKEINVKLDVFNKKGSQMAESLKDVITEHCFDDPLKCPKCGKEYKNNEKGRMWYNKHTETCGK